jgi:hypothetical protein
MPRLPALFVGTALLALGGAVPPPAHAAPSAAANPPGPAAAPAPARQPLRGQVLEATTAGGYTYLRLKTAAGEVWAAVQAADVRPGAQVTIERPITMENFESKSLKRSFDKIVFGQLAGAAATGTTAAKDPPGPPGMAMGMPGATSHPALAAGHGAAAPAGALVAKVPKMPKAEGPDGHTVADVVTGRIRLKDKTVAVRGQVVKLSVGVLGKNWVHLQDGSGSAAEGSHDLVVTTQDRPAVGDVVQVRGTVRTDVDVGAGYRYAVLLEGATLRKP